MSSELDERVLEIVRQHALIRLAEPVQLASGEMSQDFVDVKAGLAQGADLRTVCDAIVERLAAAGIDYDAVGGLTMGADQFAHGVAMVADTKWFVVRKEPKGRGTNRLVEGAAISAGWRVVLVEDTVTTGTSIQKAFDTVTELGAEVVAAVTVVDRGDRAAPFFTERGIPYHALVTWRDLDIEPVGSG